mgnify:CR=1 FL=1
MTNNQTTGLNLHVSVIVLFFSDGMSAFFVSFVLISLSFAFVHFHFFKGVPVHFPFEPYDAQVQVMDNVGWESFFSVKIGHVN